ncbi:MAG: flagellar protein FliS [Oscillospiraceae bacterium]|nr:flagellar protein FliS [Oscillospiraceae bacterium]
MNYNARGIQQYREQSLNTMTSGELLVLLLDELVKRLMRSDIALEQQDYETFESSVDRCVDIVRYLDDTLDNRYEVSRQLHRLYDFFCYDLSRVKMGRNKKELDRLRPMFQDLRDSFRAAEQSGGENRKNVNGAL